MSDKKTILVSSCIAGLCTRYDGRVIENKSCNKRLKETTWIPVCPEQLGGLSTPRTAADIKGGDGTDVLDGKARVICKDGTDVTEQFIRGAHQVLEVARRQNISTILLKARSPSCGVTKKGVTAALLEKHGFTVEEFE